MTLVTLRLEPEPASELCFKTVLCFFFDFVCKIVFLFFSFEMVFFCVCGSFSATIAVAVSMLMLPFASALTTNKN